MPVSLLDSQLHDLDVPDPAELFMCFGHLPGTRDSTSGPGHGNHAVQPMGREQHAPKHVDVSSGHCIGGGSITGAGYRKVDSMWYAAEPFSTADDIVAAIVSRIKPPIARC